MLSNHAKIVMGGVYAQDARRTGPQPEGIV